MKRVCVYAKDVSILTGKSLRHSQKTLQNLKFILNKSKNQYITVMEFAEYSGIDPVSIETKLGN
ncbi:hypothetical protein ACS5PU_07350 [Pedobacter sp. GSP4]|uniref:hypothetical protein n=1 Tax=Pedobacter sp. GSP4 TaxID=3453716 RepID=UPI003EEA7E5A